MTDDEELKLYVALERRWKAMTDSPEKEKEYSWIEYVVEMGMSFFPERQKDGNIHIQNPACLGGGGLLYVSMPPEVAEKILVLGGMP